MTRRCFHFTYGGSLSSLCKLQYRSLNNTDIRQVRPVPYRVKLFLISVGLMDISGDLLIS